ncbi:MAG: hypothetical protein WCA49_13950 [Candidatus Sulfotelmatobacter sp.]
MKRIILHAYLVALALVLTTGVASAQFGPYKETITAGPGTLSYSVSYNLESCHVGPNGWSGLQLYYSGTYSSFSYTAAGTTTTLAGDDSFTTGTEPGTCGILPSYPPITWWISSAEIVFTPSGLTGGSAIVTALTPGILYPKWQVQEIIYDTPGDKSMNGFQDVLTDGTTTSVGSSYMVGNTTTFSVNFGFLWGTSTLSWSYGNAKTTGNSTAVTSTISDATGVANASDPTGPNTINHQQDLFIIWLNPAVIMYQTGPTAVTYALGTQLQTTGDPNPGVAEIQDQVEVYAQAMMANSKGLTTVPINILKEQIVDGQTLPGLANICANQEYYPNNCSADPNGQCGCVAKDFAGILLQDAILNYSSTESPLNANASSAAACTNAAPTAKCRFVPIMTSDGSDVQVTELLSGPDEVGGNNPPNSFMQTDSTTTTQTYSESNSSSVGFSWKQMWGTASDGVGLQNSTTWTWTNSESTGQINGTAHTMSVTLSSSTVDCYQHIPIFEDTVFHTFVFTQPAGDTSCP